MSAAAPASLKSTTPVETTGPVAISAAAAPVVNTPTRIPMQRPPPNFNGFAVPMRIFPDPVAIGDACTGMTRVRPTDQVQIVNPVDMDRIGRTCWESINSLEWSRKMIQHIPVQDRTIFIGHRPGAFDEARRVYNLEEYYLTLGQILTYWDYQVNSWITANKPNTPLRDELFGRMMACLTVCTNTADRFIEISVFSL